jgi:hypothetical protein
MIQRKQSLWLLLSLIVAALSIKFPFFTGNKVAPDGTKIYQELNAQYNLVILIATILIASASLFIIFLYKERKRQMLFCFITLLVSFLLIYLYYQETQLFFDGTLSVTCILVLLIPVSLIFALIGIFKDEKLIKSVGRIR